MKIQNDEEKKFGWGSGWGVRVDVNEEFEGVRWCVVLVGGSGWM